LLLIHIILGKVNSILSIGYVPFRYSAIYPDFLKKHELVF